MRSTTALAPVDHDGAQMIDARGLHGWLGVGRAFAAWMQGRIAEYRFEEGTDFLLSETGKRKGRGGANRKEYLLTIDMAKELAMVERTEVGRATRRYFIQMEQAAQEMVAAHLANGTPEAIPQNGLGFRTIAREGCRAIEGVCGVNWPWRGGSGFSVL